MTGPDDRIAELSQAKRELLSRWLAAAEERPATAAYAPARTGAEHALVEIWQQVLEVDPVGIDDDYFELGGDSVHAIVVVARAQQAGLRIGTQDLLDGRTIRTVAGLAAAAEPTGTPEAPDTAGQVAGTEHPLTPLQQGMLYHSVGGSTPGAYLVQLRCRLVGELDQEAFRSAWQAVFAANPALRMVVRWADRDHPGQAFVPGLSMPIEFVEFGRLDGAAWEDAFTELLAEDRRRGFDLERGPLMRLVLVPEGPSAHRCVWTYHHLVLDGWSQQLVLRDVFDNYRSLRAGQPAAPRQRPSFETYLGWLAAQPEPDGEFWRRRLGDLPAATRVAGPGCVDGQLVTAERPQVDLVLPAPVADALAAFGRRHGVTAGTLVHAGWALLLGVHTGRDDVLYGATLSGRPPELPGVTESVGMYVNTLPLRVPAPADAVVLEWLGEVQRRLGELRERQHVALSRIERTVGLTYGGGLFDSIVVVENFPTWIRGGDEVAGLRIERLSVVVEEGYPLVLEFTAGTDPVLRARYDQNRLDRPAVTATLRALATLLDAVLADPAQRVGDLRARIAAAWRTNLDDERGALRGEAGRRLDGARRRAAPASVPDGSGAAGEDGRRAAPAPVDEGGRR
ncbi:condensation domain-containing protein [Plantactinospora sp. CA-294935]|uniref:condensation domain-containing protein n=1 Tax=Plantactinospora sp. CA-294935 TaxID=3240012 RepID=UPI003D8ED2D9